MKAAICYEPGKPLAVEDGVTVDSPGKGEVKVRAAATAICHSDLHFINGDIPFRYPGLAGHETAGYVEEIGAGVTELKPGDAVVLGTVTSGCGQCYYCKVGLSHLCRAGKMGGPAPGHHMNKKGQRLGTMAGPVGGFAEYTTISQTLVTKIPPDMPLDRACLLACGVTTGIGAVINRAQVKPMSSVLVVGTGGVGLNVIQGAILTGAYPIIAVDILDNKLEFAKKFGATHTVNIQKEKDPVDAVLKMTSGRGADYVFVTVGSIDALRQGFSMSGPRGMTVIIGLMNGSLSSFTPMEFLFGEKTLTACGGGSIKPGLDIPYLVSLYKSGRLKLDELITAKYPLDNINEAIAALDKGDTIRNIIMF